MPIPFIIAGVVAAGTAIATSKKCNRCDDRFWSSDCDRYCQSCCDERERERQREEERLRLKQERQRKKEKERARIEAEKARLRELKRVEKEKQRAKKAEIARLKAIEDAKIAKLKAIEDEKKRKRLLLKQKANKKRKSILDSLIKDLKKNELSNYKKNIKQTIFMEIDKDKNQQLQRINESQKMILSEKDFEKYIKFYIEEV